MPENYPVCQFDKCKVAATCLHQLVFSKVMETNTVLHLLNPNMCSKTGNCRFYRNSEPVAYACGFTNFQMRMFPRQYQEFMEILKGVFGRNAYFERRNGTRAMSPQEQEIVLDALKEVGVTEDLRFDRYEENVNWND